LLTLLFILFIAIVALSNLVPPTVVPAPAPVTDFSAERAMKHLKVIARDPHPTGSIENARVRDYSKRGRAWHFDSNCNAITPGWSTTPPLRIPD